MIERLSTLIDRPLAACAALFDAGPARVQQFARPRWEIWSLCLFLVLGAAVRFWGLGSFGLHKPDEDTTALAAVHVLQDGTPRFPSGMFYARAIVQSYMIAASVKAFGQTEWALRLPSALCGLALIVLAYFFGRRFLAPVWNVAFVAVISLLPGLIADSQEVRMYSFLIASLTAYAALLFKWEDTSKLRYLVGALVAMIVALQFQVIGVFGILLVLFPGLLHGDAKKFVQGSVAFVAIAVSYLLIARWNSSFYPTQAVLHVSASAKVTRISDYYHLQFWPFIGALLGAGLLAWFVTNRVRNARCALIAGLLTFAALICQVLLFYHVGILLLLSAVVLTWRHGGGDIKRLATIICAMAALAVTQFLVLYAAGVGPFRKILGAMIGLPSIWSYFRVGQYSWIAFASVSTGLVWAVWRVTSGRKIGEYWLFFLLGFVVPLFLLGFFDWYIPPRYGEFALLPMLVCAFAFWQSIFKRSITTFASSGVVSVAAITVVAIAAVNPLALAHTVNAGKSFADHRGAADYIRRQKLGPKDIVIAEEVLLQTYYLGHVDYWLYSTAAAAEFLERIDGKLVDEYTHTPIIGTEAELRTIIDRPDRGAIYIIGSGEGQEDGRRQYRGDELFHLLTSDQFKTVFVARDRLTKVWKIDAPAAVARVN